jgi:hypothetical protein
MIRKFIPSILIALIIVNLFAPFTLGVNKKNNIEIKKSVAEASPGLNITVGQGGLKINSIKLLFKVTRFKKTDYHGLFYMVTDKSGTKIRSNIPEEIDFGVNGIKIKGKTAVMSAILSGMFDKDQKLQNNFYITPEATKVIRDAKESIAVENTGDTVTISETIGGLSPGKEYYLSYAAYSFNNLPNADDPIIFETDISMATATDASSENDQYKELTRGSSGDGYMPACWLGLTDGGISMSGCVAQLIYTLFFRPTSYLFGLAGQFFDFSFFYSISDKSYRSGFVLEGWGIVRDFVNMFFIFVLLYIAFATILSINGFKTKEMIINVVIIGLLINFSLFATQVIIDTSNILARVFYNSVTLTGKEAKKAGIDAPGTNGETQLSAKVVNMVDPQRLIMEASTVGKVKDKGGSGDNSSSSIGISNATFILVTLLASAVNVVGIFVFLSVGLIFIARVIGLWFAMIFVPFAFFSYTIPAMQSIEMIGWKKWWPETLKLAFLAPIFMFFMYLIIKFLGGKEFLSGLNKGDSGAAFIIGIIVPFVFIMILLLRAKDIAKDMSGKIGSAVTGGAAAIGGLALGGAALGTAALGRQTLGSVNKYIQNDTARKSALGFKDAGTAWKKVKANPLTWLNTVPAIGKSITGTGKAGAALIAQATHIKVGGKSLGKGMQNEEAAFGKKVSSKNKLDSTADNEFGGKGKYEKGVKFNELTEPEQQEVRKSIDKDQLAKQNGWTNFEAVKDPLQKAAISNTIETAHTAYEAAPKNNVAQITAAETTLKTATTITGTDKTSGDMIRLSKANAALGEFASSLRRGSYDARELSKIKKSGTLAAIGVGAIGLGVFPLMGAALAVGASSGIKKGLKSALSGLDSGTGQKDFLKDLGNVLTSALSSLKVGVKVDKDDGHAKANAGGGGKH